MIIGLDIGDVWTGIALANTRRTRALPYITVKTADLPKELSQLLKKYDSSIIVVGYPLNIMGSESAQAQIIKKKVEELSELFPQVEWHFWNERYSSKRAEQLVFAGKRHPTKQDKLHAHAVAAAFILDAYKAQTS